MSFTLSENWDSVTAPAIPGTWNVDSQIVTSTTRFRSSPNGLTLGSGTADTKYYATYSVADSGAGATFDITQFIYVDSLTVPGNYDIGPTFRCSAATMNNSSTTCYWFYLHYVLPTGSQQFRFAKIINGAVTDLYTVYSGTGEITTGQWLSIRVICTGSNTFNVTITRDSDGWTMDQFGVFKSTPSVAVVNFVNSDVASGGYYGMCASATATNSRIYMDDAVANASGGTVILTPRLPTIVPIPFRCYPKLAD